MARLNNSITVRQDGKVKQQYYGMSGWQGLTTVLRYVRMARFNNSITVCQDGMVKQQHYGMSGWHG